MTQIRSGSFVNRAGCCTKRRVEGPGSLPAAPHGYLRRGHLGPECVLELVTGRSVDVLRLQEAARGLEEITVRYLGGTALDPLALCPFADRRHAENREDVLGRLVPVETAGEQQRGSLRGC